MCPVIAVFPTLDPPLDVVPGVWEYQIPMTVGLNKLGGRNFYDHWGMIVPGKGYYQECNICWLLPSKVLIGKIAYHRG